MRAQRQADHLPDDPAGRGVRGARRRAAASRWTTSTTTTPARCSGSRRAARHLRTGAVRPDDCLVPGRVRLLDELARARPAALPGQRHRRGVRRGRGRAARTDRLLRQPHLRRAGRLQEFSKKMVIERILRENEVAGESLLGLRRRLRGDREHEGGGRRRGRRRQRRGRPQRQARRLETRPPHRRRRRPRHPGFPRGRPAGRLSLRAD